MSEDQHDLLMSILNTIGREKYMELKAEGRLAYTTIPKANVTPGYFWRTYVITTFMTKRFKTQKDERR